MRRQQLAAAPWAARAARASAPGPGQAVTVGRDVELRRTKPTCTHWTPRISEKSVWGTFRGEGHGPGSIGDPGLRLPRLAGARSTTFSRAQNGSAGIPASGAGPRWIEAAGGARTVGRRRKPPRGWNPPAAIARHPVVPGRAAASASAVRPCIAVAHGPDFPALLQDVSQASPTDRQPGAPASSARRRGSLLNRVDDLLRRLDHVAVHLLVSHGESLALELRRDDQARLPVRPRGGGLQDEGERDHRHELLAWS